MNPKFLFVSAIFLYLVVFFLPPILVALKLIHPRIKGKSTEVQFILNLLVVVIIPVIQTIFCIIITLIAMKSSSPWLNVEESRKIVCSGNLKQIGLAFLIYAEEHSGFFPNDQPYGGNNVEILNSMGYLNNGRVYGCPSFTTVSSVASNMDYIYVGSGLRDDDKDSANTPMLFEFADSHPGRSQIYVLYIDGHVEGHKGNKWEEITGLKKEEWMRK